MYTRLQNVNGLIKILGLCSWYNAPRCCHNHFRSSIFFFFFFCCLNLNNMHPFQFTSVLQYYSIIVSQHHSITASLVSDHSLLMYLAGVSFTLYTNFFSSFYLFFFFFVNDTFVFVQISIHLFKVLRIHHSTCF